jgi:hypothetical protein
MYTFFRAATGLSASRLTQTDDLMEMAGFCRRGQYETNFGLVRAELWERNAR